VVGEMVQEIPKEGPMQEALVQATKTQEMPKEAPVQEESSTAFPQDVPTQVEMVTVTHHWVVTAPMQAW
jgi:hypothetical protein